VRRIELLQLLAARCAPGTVLGIDGPDAAGKTTLADALAAELGVRALRATVDGFHLPAAERHVLPYEDSFDVQRLVSQLLEPFRTGAPSVLVRSWDWVRDAPDPVEAAVPADGVLVLDGVFLGQVRDQLDVWVFLDVPPEVTLARAAVRDLAFSAARYRERYLPAQARYRATVRADLVVDNRDPEQPRLLP
jgi:uridine kinase